MNLVAKHAGKFNRCTAFKDRTKYSRDNRVEWEDEPPVYLFW